MHRPCVGTRPFRKTSKNRTRILRASSIPCSRDNSRRTRETSRCNNSEFTPAAWLETTESSTVPRIRVRRSPSRFSVPLPLFRSTDKKMKSQRLRRAMSNFASATSLSMARRCARTVHSTRYMQRILRMHRSSMQRQGRRVAAAAALWRIWVIRKRSQGRAPRASASRTLENQRARRTGISGIRFLADPRWTAARIHRRGAASAF